LAAGASIEARLVAAQVAIDIVMADPSLQAIMAAYGYDVARMRQGRALREQALALYQQQRTALGDRFAATDARASAHARAHAVYIRHLAVARVALRGDRGAAQKLDLAKSRKRAQAIWQIQAQQFYANALSDSAIVKRLGAIVDLPRLSLSPLYPLVPIPAPVPYAPLELPVYSAWARATNPPPLPAWERGRG